MAASNRRAARGLASVAEVNFDELREQTAWGTWAAVSKTTTANQHSNPSSAAPVTDQLAAVQARPRAGLDRACSRQRSKVPAAIPISRATTSIAALSGGSNRATALSLNVCPYRAKFVLHRRPRG